MSIFDTNVQCEEVYTVDASEMAEVVAEDAAILAAYEAAQASAWLARRSQLLFNSHLMRTARRVDGIVVE